MKPVSVFAILFLFISLALAQGRGGMQGQGRQGAPGMQRGQGQGTGMQQQNRDRMRVHAPQHQQVQYRKCEQVNARLRNRVREMSRYSRQRAFNTAKMRQVHQQFREEFQLMQQQHQSLVSGLDQEQKDAAQTQLQSFARNQEQLAAFSDALGLELDQISPDQDRIRDQVRNMDRTTKQLQEQQHDIAAELGLD